ncbi:MAG: hypothetical protein JRH20_07435 [Deltaproteobacteria bacterium]|nr:hypothetical protein [Deltaproteobacteria bacterium]
MMMNAINLFGDWLIQRGLIDREQLFEALCLSYQEECRVGDALVELGVLQRPTVEEEAQAHRLYHAFTP